MKFVSDKYKKKRGGYTRLLKVCCRKCAQTVCLYQKDGPGNLRRLYIDRVFNPQVDFNATYLKCTCGVELGKKIVYEKEDRPAQQLFVDAVYKSIIKSE